jgi:hypothetical protein
VAVRVENLTDRPVQLDLPSGRSVRLSPRDNSPRLTSAEVRGSTMIDKLIRRGVLAVHEEQQPPAATTVRARARRPEPATAATEETP